MIKPNKQVETFHIALVALKSLIYITKSCRELVSTSTIDVLQYIDVYYIEYRRYSSAGV